MQAHPVANPGTPSPAPSTPSEARASSTAARPAQHRTKTGCLTCRRRKVKCDEGRPVCGKCTIKKRECVWPDEGSASLPHKRANSSPHASSHLPRPASNFPAITTSPIDDLFASLQYPAPATAPQTIDPFQFHFPSNPFTLHPPPPVAPAPVQLPFDPTSFLDLLPLLSAPQATRFYVPPDFLPKTGIDEHRKALLSTDHLDHIIRPNRKAAMMADPAFLQPYFPTIEERLTMRHYLLETAHIIMAFECHRKPWNPWIEIHAPLAFNHLPGVSPAADALRAAMIAVGAVHLRYRHDPTDQAGAWRIIRGAKAKVLSLVRQRIEEQDVSKVPLEKEDVELILAALLSCTIASSLAADDSWHELLTSVLKMVEQLGGAQSLLKLGSRDRISSFRFFLEQLAIRDVFGCMTTQMAPTILNTAFSPWFFEAEEWSKGDDEWESVERMFGFSRGMVDVIARSCTLISKVKLAGRTLPEPPKASENTRKDFSLRLPHKAMSRLTGDSDMPEEKVDPQTQELLRDARGLVAELTVWDNAANFTPFHPRTQYGNLSYRHATRIRLLREVFGVSREDPRVQSSCAAIIELGTELLALFGRITWLTWPIIIAAFNMLPGDPSRQTALTLLSEFGQFASFDNGVAGRMLADFYHHEAIDGAKTPAQVADRLRSKPFLD